MDVRLNNSRLSSEGATLAKIIATFSVVLTHSYKLFKYMNVDNSSVFYLRGFHAFASCGVPVFFLLSGYFLTFKGNWDYKKNIKKKVKSLVIPYFLFTAFYAIISCIGALALPSFFDNFKEFTANDWIMHLFGIPFVIAPSFYGPLWFVRELLVLNIASVILVPLVKKIPGYILLPAMAVVYFLPIPQIIRYSIPFFIVGMYFGFKKSIPVITNNFYIIGLFVVGFAIPIVFEGDLAWKVSVLLMAIFIITISEKLVVESNISKIAKTAIPFSFPIYLLHEYPMTTTMRLLAMKRISVPLATAAFLIVPFLIIALCVIVIIVWKRLLPKSFSVFTGGRY